MKTYRPKYHYESASSPSIPVRVIREPRFAIEHIRDVFQLDPVRSWFFKAIRRQRRQLDILLNFPDPPVPIVYYEFGVGWGGSLRKYICALRTHCQITGEDFSRNPLFGFDTFLGLPAKKDFRDDNPEWTEGAYKHDSTEISKLLQEEGIAPKSGQARLIAGAFEASLTPTLREELRTTAPHIINVDVDYYSSTREVLDWLRPFLPDGALFYFDDIWAFNGDPRRGELGAINEFNTHPGGRLVPFPILGLAGSVFIFSMGADA